MSRFLFGVFVNYGLILVGFVIGYFLGHHMHVLKVRDAVARRADRLIRGEPDPDGEDILGPTALGSRINAGRHLGRNCRN